MLCERVEAWLGKPDRTDRLRTHGGGCLRSIFRLVGGLSEGEAAALSIPQDKVLEIGERPLAWRG